MRQLRLAAQFLSWSFAAPDWWQLADLLSEGAMSGRVLWLCPAAGVDPPSPLDGVVFVCAHSAADLTRLLSGTENAAFEVVVLDAMPIEPYGYDPAVVATTARRLLAASPRHAVYIARPGLYACSDLAQAAFAVEAHAILGQSASFILQLGARYDVGVPASEAATVGETPGGSRTAAPRDDEDAKDAKDPALGMTVRWREIAQLAARLARGLEPPSPLVPPPPEPASLVGALHPGKSGFSPAARAVLVALVDGIAASAVPLAARTSYSSETVRKAAKEIALIRPTHGRTGAHWTMSTASALAHDYGAWLSSHAQRAGRAGVPPTGLGT